MAFSITNEKTGQIYYLHRCKHYGDDNRFNGAHYFSKTIKDNAVDEFPKGYMIVYSYNSTLPLLKKIPILNED